MFTIIDQTIPYQTVTHAQNSHEKKILLVTLYGVGNYGNVLQRYALTKILEQYGFTVEHLCGKLKLDFVYLCKRIVKRFLAFLRVKKYLGQFRREKLFIQFQDKYISKKIFTKFRNALHSSKSQWQEYKFVVSGSD